MNGTPKDIGDVVHICQKGRTVLVHPLYCLVLASRLVRNRPVVTAAGFSRPVCLTSLLSGPWRCVPSLLSVSVRAARTPFLPMYGLIHPIVRLALGARSGPGVRVGRVHITVWIGPAPSVSIVASHTNILRGIENLLCQWSEKRQRMCQITMATLAVRGFVYITLACQSKHIQTFERLVQERA